MVQGSTVSMHVCIRLLPGFLADAHIDPGQICRGAERFQVGNFLGLGTLPVQSDLRNNYGGINTVNEKSAACGRLPQRFLDWITAARCAVGLAFHAFSFFLIRPAEHVMFFPPVGSPTKASNKTPTCVINCGTIYCGGTRSLKICNLSAR